MRETLFYSVYVWDVRQWEESHKFLCVFGSLDEFRMFGRSSNTWWKSSKPKSQTLNLKATVKLVVNELQQDSQAAIPCCMSCPSMPWTLLESIWIIICQESKAWHHKDLQNCKIWAAHLIDRRRLSAPGHYDFSESLFWGPYKKNPTI